MEAQRLFHFLVPIIPIEKIEAQPAEVDDQGGPEPAAAASEEINYSGGLTSSTRPPVRCLVGGSRTPNGALRVIAPLRLRPRLFCAEPPLRNRRKRGSEWRGTRFEGAAFAVKNRPGRSCNARDIYVDVRVFVGRR